MKNKYYVSFRFISKETGENPVLARNCNQEEEMLKLS